MKKTILIILLIIILISLGCAKTKEIEKDVTISIKDDLETVDEETNETQESEETKEIETGQITGENLLKIRIWIEKSPEKSEISLNGGVEKFMVDSLDEDVILFDLAEKYDKPLKYIKQISEVVGTTEHEKIEEEKEIDTKPVDFEDMDYEWKKEDGLIRGVGCSFSNRKIKIQITNPFNKTLNLLRKGVSPMPPNIIRISLNSQILYEIECEQDSIAYNETIVCTDTDVVFVKLKSTFDESYKDKLAIIMTGYSDQFKFLCE